MYLDTSLSGSSASPKMPTGVTTARASVMTWPPGSHASTFGGNPVSCAAALETIRLLRERLIANAAEVTALLATHGFEHHLPEKRSFADQVALVEVPVVQGQGGVRVQHEREPDLAHAAQVHPTGERRHLHTHGAGHRSDHPLSVSD